MNVRLRNLVVAAFAGTVAMGFGMNAMADSTFDLVQALVAKGVLTEEEAIPLLKSREQDISIADKKVKKAAKLGMSDVLDSATLYGDLRGRYEFRQGADMSGANSGSTAGNTERTRARYKMTLGVKTESGDFYSDLAFAMGASGRSDNATLGSATGGGNGINQKEVLYVKRAMIGYKATDWMNIEFGRMANPLYTTSMVWDADLTVEGLAEKVDYILSPSTNLFVNAVQGQYKGDAKDIARKGTDTETNEFFATQVGLKYVYDTAISAKAGVTYTSFSNGSIDKSTYKLDTFEVPAEIVYQTTGNLSYKLFGDYAYNTQGSDRCKALVSAAACAGVEEDSAWLLGAEVKSMADPKGKASTAGDWKAALWYQSVGAFALDPNAVDSDLMDSVVNMEGTVAKAEYAVRNNVFVNLTGAFADIKNKKFNTFKNVYTSASGDLGALKLNNYSLFQFDVNYKF